MWHVLYRSYIIDFVIFFTPINTKCCRVVKSPLVWYVIWVDNCIHDIRDEIHRVAPMNYLSSTVIISYSCSYWSIYQLLRIVADRVSYIQFDILTNAVWFSGSLFSKYVNPINIFHAKIYNACRSCDNGDVLLKANILDFNWESLPVMHSLVTTDLAKTPSIWSQSGLPSYI